MKTHNELVFEVAKEVLPGVLNSPLFVQSIFEAMKQQTRCSIGQLITHEAWDMAEALVELYEGKQNASSVYVEPSSITV